MLRFLTRRRPVSPHPVTPPSPAVPEPPPLPRGIPLGWAEHAPGGYHPLTYTHDQHLVTIGPTGSGKNTRAQTPALLDPRNPASALVIDVKGQLCALTTRQRQALGHTVAVLNPYGVLGFPSARYNPLAHLDPAAPSFVSDCERLAEGLVELRKGDHWELSALDYVTLLLMWVVRFDTPKTLTRVWQLLGADDATRQDLCLQMQACAYAPIAERAGRYTSDRGEVADSIQTARAQCVVLGDPAIQALMQDGPGALRFANLKRRPLTIFLIIPPELLHTRAKFLRLLVMAALGELIREPTQPPDPVLLLLDEFAQLGPLPMIENAAAIVRDYKLRLWIILQNLPQLQDLYGNRWESFLSSAGVVQVFTPNDMTTAGYFAKRAGQQPHWPRNIAPLQAHISYSEQQQPLYTEQDLLGLLPDKQLLFHYGQARPQESWRFPYLPLGDVDPTAPYYQRYAGTYDPDPYHLDTAARAAFVQQAPRGAWHLPCPAGRQEGVTRGCRRRGAQGAASRRPRRQPHTEGR